MENVKWHKIKGASNYEVSETKDPTVRNRKTGRVMRKNSLKGYSWIYTDGPDRKILKRTPAFLLYCAVNGIDVKKLTSDTQAVILKWDGTDFCLTTRDKHLEKLNANKPYIKTYSAEEIIKLSEEASEFMKVQAEAVRTGDFSGLFKFLSGYIGRLGLMMAPKISREIRKKLSEDFNNRLVLEVCEKIKSGSPEFRHPAYSMGIRAISIIRAEKRLKQIRTVEYLDSLKTKNMTEEEY